MINVYPCFGAEQRCSEVGWEIQISKVNYVCEKPKKGIDEF